MPPPNPFVNLVAAQTGLDPRVLGAWTRAEGGPLDNPLNIGPGRHYGSARGAAAATAHLLGEPLYAGILRQRGNPSGEIAAIKASPWDASHYSNGVLDRTAAGFGIRGRAVPSNRAALGSAPAQNSSGLDGLLGQVMQSNDSIIGVPAPPIGLLEGDGPSGHADLSAVPRSGHGLIQLALKFRGLPYRWGGTSPKTGFDCSGFVQWLYKQQGVSLPRTTYQQWRAGTPVGRGQLRAGDIVFFEPSSQGPGHEGLYIGGGKFIESPHTGAAIRVSTLANRPDFVGARRV